MFLAISPLVPCEDTPLVCSVYFFFLVLFVVVKCNTIHVIFLIEFFKSYFSVTALTLCGIPQRSIFRSNNPSFSSVICLSLPKVWCYSTLIKISLLFQQNDYCGKVFKYWVISGPYFSVFGLNAEIYGVNLRIPSKCRKIRTRNNSVFGHFSRSGHKWDLKLSKDFTNFCGGFPASINMLKVNNQNITTMCEICSKLTIRNQNDINANEVIDIVLWCLYC